MSNEFPQDLHCHLGDSECECPFGSLSSAQMTICLCLIGDLTIGFLGRQEKRSLKARKDGERHSLRTSSPSCLSSPILRFLHFLPIRSAHFFQIWSSELPLTGSVALGKPLTLSELDSLTACYNRWYWPNRFIRIKGEFMCEPRIIPSGTCNIRETLLFVHSPLLT